MAENKIGEVIATSLEKIRELVDAQTIIGEPINTANGTTIIPVSKVTMGFASGGIDYTSKQNDPKAVAARGNFGGGGDLGTKESFKDFELSVDFRLTPAANSGIKSFYDKNKFGGTCEEYQILDPEHPDAKRGRNGNRRVAALYDMMPASADKVVRPAGEWNTAKIVSKGSHVEHWLNGKKVLEYERGSEQFREFVKRSKYKSSEKKDGARWGETPEGRIKLQDHTDSTVSFRNIKIRRL